MTSADRETKRFSGEHGLGRALFFSVCVGVLLFLAAGCRGGPQEYVLTGMTMGTTYTVKAVEAGRDLPRATIADTIFAIDKVYMSTYAPDSELSRFNRWASQEAFPLSQDTLAVFAIALEVSRQSGGAFDVTVGPLVSAWGFGPEESAPPDEAALPALRERVGYDKLLIDPVAGTAAKERPDIYCDLSAVAKGYAVDAVARLLDAQGYKNYMVEVGGEVRTAGKNRFGEAWQIAVEKPVGEGRSVQRIVPLSGQAVATSGDYRNFYEKDGLRLSHTIDPRTGRPVSHGLASVSVIHAECAWADAYATALMVLGPDEGYRFAVDHGIAAFFIIHAGADGFTERATPAFPGA